MTFANNKGQISKPEGHVKVTLLALCSQGLALGGKQE